MRDHAEKRLAGKLTYLPDTGDLLWRDREGCRGFNRAGKSAGHIHSNGYRIIRFEGREYTSHRLIWWVLYGRPPVCEIDHINGDKADNRRINLREASKSQNGWNKPSIGPHPKGVTLHKGTGKFQATICCNWRRKYLGLFKTPEEAHAAYKIAAQTLHGEFARFE